jgi:hypothetical protein
MPTKKRFMFARHFGRLGIDLAMKRQLAIQYAKERAEAEARGEEYKSPLQMLVENKEEIKAQLAGELLGDFESGIEL